MWNILHTTRQNNRRFWGKKRVESLPSSYTQTILRDDNEWKNMLQELKQNGLVTNASIKEYLARKEAARILESRTNERINLNSDDKSAHNAPAKILQKLNHVCRPRVTRKKQLESSLFCNHETFLSRTSKDVANAADKAIRKRSSFEMIIALQRIKSTDFENNARDGSRRSFYY